MRRNKADSALIALGLIRYVGGKTLKALLAHFAGDAYAVLAAEPEELRRIPGIGPKITAAIKAVDLPAVEAALNRWQQLGVRVLTLNDPAYPRLLRPLEDAPSLLFVYGSWETHVPFKGVALVGRRRPQTDSVLFTQQLAGKLVEAGYIVVSGLAYGVDRAAHQGALASAHGQTLAVLGCGVLNIYPPDHVELSRAIAGRGALIAEVAPDASVNTSALVARNRMITGLSEAVVVIETEHDGGAMHAARFARTQGRKLFVLENNASGNQILIREGATPLSPMCTGLDWLQEPL